MNAGALRRSGGGAAGPAGFSPRYIGAARSAVRAGLSAMGARDLEDGLGYGLLLAMATMVAWSVQLADWGDSPMLLWILLAAVVLGGALARSRLHPLAGHMVGLAVGIPLVIWQMSSDAEGASIAARSVDVWQRMDLWIQTARSGGISIDPLPFSVLLGGTGWVAGYFSGWTLLRWQKPWLPTLILGLPMLTNLSYRFGRFEVTFIVFALLVIVLFAHLAQRRVRARWAAAGTHYPPEMRWRGLSTAVIAGVAVVIVASALPLWEPRSDALNDYWKTARSPWKTKLEEHAQRLFPNVKGGGTRLRLRTFDPVLAFRGAISFKRRPLFQVESDYETRHAARVYSVYTSQGWLVGPAEMVPRAPAETLPLEGTLLARVSVSQRIVTSVPLGYALPADYALDVEGRGTIGELLPSLEVYLHMVPGELDPSLPGDVRAYADDLRDVFLGPNQPVASVADTLAGLLPPDLELLDYSAEGPDLEWALVRRAGPEAFDQVALRLTEPIEPEGELKIRRLISEATDQELAAAGEEYPRWVTDRYLQLPETLPQDVRDLAQRIVDEAAAETPFAKAQAISAYLRGLGYSQEIEGPAPDRDGVAYFLFDTVSEPCPDRAPGDPPCDDGAAKAYSQYFGSAHAVMLRSVGVPARMVSGYKPGTWIPDREVFEVRDSDSHGWAQAYFPSYGWIDLEATPGVQELVRGQRFNPSVGTGAVVGAGRFPVDPASELGDFEEPGGGVGGEGAGNLGGLDTGEPGRGALLWALGIGMAGLLGAAAVVLAWRWGFWRMSPAKRAYVSMRRWGWMAGLAHGSWETPREYALKVGARVPVALDGAAVIAQGYELETYGGRQLPEEAGEEAERHWPRVRSALIRRGLLRLAGFRGGGGGGETGRLPRRTLYVPRRGRPPVHGRG